LNRLKVFKSVLCWFIPAGLFDLFTSTVVTLPTSFLGRPGTSPARRPSPDRWSGPTQTFSHTQTPGRSLPRLIPSSSGLVPSSSRHPARVIHITARTPSPVNSPASAPSPGPPPSPSPLPIPPSRRTLRANFQGPTIIGGPRPGGLIHYPEFEGDFIPNGDNYYPQGFEGSFTFRNRSL
jgi:hypothetical protein